MKNEYVKYTNYSLAFNNLAFNYWRSYYINEFENSDIYKKIRDAASNGEYEVKLRKVEERELIMLQNFGITFTIAHSHECIDLKTYDKKVIYDITVSWRIKGL